MNTCYYCGLLIGELSADHIFPQFLGGRRTIPSCRKCNNQFGHEFEGAAAKLLLPLYVLLAKWGVPVPEANKWWRSAYVVDGALIDLGVGPNGIRARAAKPIITRNAGGEIEEAYFETATESNRFLRTMRDRKPHVRWVPSDKRVETNLSNIRLGFEVGPALQQLALKVCVGAATLLPEVRPTDLTTAGHILRNTPTNPHPLVSHQFGRYTSIDDVRPPLAHTLYVEHRCHELRGIVQFFGAVQLFCSVANDTRTEGDTAILGWVDPVDGNEHFEDRRVIGLIEPPYGYSPPEVQAGLADWIARLGEGAKRRGAMAEPEFRVRMRLDLPT